MFVAERRPEELAVWLQGEPQHSASVPVQGDHNVLRVRYGPQTPGPLKVLYSGKSGGLALQGTV